MLTRVTNFLIRKSHREVTKGLKYRWITFLRKYPDYYRYLYKTYQQPVVPHLTQIHLELTNRCDLKCKACSNADKSGPKGMMSTQTAKDIIDETMRIAGPGCIMGFYIRGESTLHPDLPGLIDYARSKGFKHLLLCHFSIVASLLDGTNPALFFSFFSCRHPVSLHHALHAMEEL